ncbi:MAG: hypothetical protein CVV64_14820 [Candidatus Wallbacteria bacterium HGW-Wallbacteria-1]|jgi:nicotinamide-nucleotide amidase|uniref:MoaB/Mog domain-containing protein n=1 Tax=Candidatus Wallbacteria bacterium HGW-Wallbacteria-1 TaxID=2013854 RepID=A0A2N1PLW1_9BACT|nr:MAG: hypothetical protein CVV64_14820 [Candidatus Wallbacteria bacterium HGW-Wallbacteria-1]
MARVAIVATGEEILRGWGCDTGSLEISSYLEELGFEVCHRSVVGDNQDEISALLVWCLNSFDLTVTIGGLGCTPDDLTRDAAAIASGRRLTFDSTLFEQVSKKMSRRPGPQHHPFGMRIEGASIIPNSSGVAPGQFLLIPESGSGKSASALLLLPGPSSERKAIFSAIADDLNWIGFCKTMQFHGHVKGEFLHLRAYGVFESAVTEALTGPFENWSLFGTYLVGRRCVKIVLRHAVGYERQVVEQVSEKLPSAILTPDDEPGIILNRIMAENPDFSLSCAESVSGGLAASAIVDAAGASSFFRGGIVAYTDEMKMSLLNVPEETLRNFGAVSSQAAGFMAAGAVGAFESTHGVSCSGIAGPGTGSCGEPEGLVWFGLAWPGGLECFSRTFRGDRNDIRIQAADSCVLLMVIRLLGLNSDGWRNDFPQGICVGFRQ